jgi:hypothetical protein
MVYYLEKNSLMSRLHKKILISYITTILFCIFSIISTYYLYHL